MSADELAAVVAELGALPMPVPVVPEPQQVDAGPVVLPLALHEAQLDALAASGNRAVNDAVHEDLCACDAWPKECSSSGGFFQGYWDMGSLETAIPAVLGLWERMRGGELAALTARVAELERTVRQMVDGLNGHDCPPPGESPMGAVTRFAVRLMEAERLLAEDGCSCPPVDRSHQIGCPLDGVPAPGPDAVTTSYTERAAAETDPARRTAWRMLAEPEPEFHAYLHHPYQREHDMPEGGPQ